MSGRSFAVLALVLGLLIAARIVQECRSPPRVEAVGPTANYDAEHEATCIAVGGRWDLVLPYTHGCIMQEKRK